MSVNGEMVSVYSSPLPCESCPYALKPIGGFSRAKNCMCQKYDSVDNMKPYGVLFNNEECKYNKMANDGGPGSGNFGHSGRPGKVGGSSKGSGSKEYRTQSTSGSYVGIQKAKAFKSIAKQARSAKDVKSFVDSLSKEQYDQLVNQYRSCGTKEKIWDYTERVMDLMKKQKPDKFPPHKIVDAKSILDKYDTFHKEYDSYTDPSTGQVIDEQIEDAMYKQGYLGLPKVVSQEEFDRIVEEHPEMPLLYRSYTGKDPEQLQDFDDQLEGGEWYVDCGTGGAGYGQGMYCAGVYPKEQLYKWDDPNLDEDFEKGRADLVVFTDNSGNGYVTKEKIDPQSAEDLYVGTPYLVVNEDGKRSMIKMDDDSYMWVDVNTGALLSDDKVNEIVMGAKEVYELKDQDLGIYKDANNKDRKEGIKGALNEMDHYRHIGAQRVMEETLPDPPDGKNRASYGDKHYYYDMNEMATFDERKPKDGDIIAIMNPKNMDFFNKYGPSLWRVERGMLLDNVDPNERHTMVLKFDEVEPYEKWAKIEGECEKPKLNPTSATRLMTLDPSAKIITYKELTSMKSEWLLMRQKAQQEYWEKVDEIIAENPEAETFCKMYRTMSPETREYQSSRSEANRKASKMLEPLEKEFREKEKEIKKYGNIAYLDEGVIATILGYDAINAEGHGSSDSYTIVLNRTKLIISDQRVDTRR